VRVTRLRFESDDGIALRGNGALSDAALMANALAHGTICSALIWNYPDPWRSDEVLQEVLVESRVVRTHHDEELDIRK